jgi:hypothetical protein
LMVRLTSFKMKLGLPPMVTHFEICFNSIICAPVYFTCFLVLTLFGS